jgi:hypothetical protein
MPFAVWGVPAITVRISGIYPPRLVSWLKAGALVLFGTGIVLFALDRSPHFAHAVYTNAWGLWTACLWIPQRYKLENQNKLVTLNLSANEQTSARQ